MSFWLISKAVLPETQGMKCKKLKQGDHLGHWGKRKKTEFIVVNT